AARRLRAESEKACDDLALVFGARPSDYAEHLLDIVTCVRDHYTPSVALAMAHRKEFEGRMLAILNPELQRRGPSRKAAVSYAFALAGISLVIGAAAPVPRIPAGLAGTVVPNDSTTLSSDTAELVTLPAPSEKVSEQTPARDPVPSIQDAEVDPDDVDPDVELPDDKRAELLARILRSDSSAEARRIAAWGLQDYARIDVAVQGLISALESDPDAGVREMSAWALANASRKSAAGAALVNALQEGDAATRTTAVWALGNIGDRSTVEPLARILSDSDPATRNLAAWSIGNCDPKLAPAPLVAALSDEDRDVRLSVAWALYEIEDPATADELDAALLQETDPEVQLGMIRALGVMGDRSVEALERLITSPDSRIRTMAITALAGGNAGGPWPWPRP
ncbi:MAG: HEAT repeat domain-containing protein, partial [Gemmatimonadales bacterium]